MTGVQKSHLTVCTKIDPLSSAQDLALEFAASVSLQPYGVLGQQFSREGRFIDGVGPDPKQCPSVCITDPAGLHHIQPPGGPRGAGGAAGAIYKWLGIGNESTFPAEVVKSISAQGHAKYHAYAAGRGLIHVVSIGLDVLTHAYVPGTIRSVLHSKC